MKQQSSPDEWRMYRFGVKVGFCALLAGSMRSLGPRKALGKITQPVNTYTRFAEFFLVENCLPLLQEGLQILDIGSPKIFSLWLASKYRVNISAIDIWEPAVTEAEYLWAKSKSCIRPKGEISFEVHDARTLAYRSETFDAVYCISVIEHLHNDGDSAGIREIARILKPGAFAVLTFPIGSQFVEQCRDRALWSGADQPRRAFFQRIYNRESIGRRLLVNDSLQVVKILTIDKGSYCIATVWRALPISIRAVLGSMNPLLSRLANRKIVEGLVYSCNERYGVRYKQHDIYNDAVLVFQKSRGAC